MNQADRDRRFMALALQLAARGRGTTSPNPMVGAVIASGDCLIAQAYHRRAGGLHAEAAALEQAGPAARGATLYLTLEPCCHTKKRTPPCLPLVLAAGLARVVVAMPDPNPLVRGKSLRALRRAGVAVSVGCFADDAAALNRIYCHWMTSGRPWVMLKAAMTLDGKIATAGGASQWITGPEARADVHRVRSGVDAVLIGAGTAARDNPQLTARRFADGVDSGRLAARQPVRVLVDSRLRIAPSARLFRQVRTLPVIVATTSRAPLTRRAALQRRGVEVLVLPSQRGGVSLPKLLQALATRRISSVLVEGGGTLNAAFVRSHLVDQIRWYVAPQVLGGQDALSVVGGRSPSKLAMATRLGQVTLEQLGPDMVIDGLVLAHS